MNKCLYCQKETTNQKFCSRSCSGKMGPRPTKEVRPFRNCVRCDKEFVPTDNVKKFCSISCSAITSNVLRAKIRNCLNCNKTINKTQSKYCSYECNRAYKNKEMVVRWVSGEWDGSSKHGLSASLRKYLINQANGKCPECGWNKINPTTGKVPLEVDHIDGDCYNNTKENLRVLCPNCHSLTSNYRALNKKSQRFYRKKYYDHASMV